MGDPHNVAGLPYNVGTCKAGGVSLFLGTRQYLGIGSSRISANRTPSIVCCPTFRVQMRSVQRRTHQVVLRRCRSLLLQRHRCQRPPGLRYGIRLAGIGLYQEQAVVCTFTNLSRSYKLGTSVCEIYDTNVTVFFRVEQEAADQAAVMEEQALDRPAGCHSILNVGAKAGEERRFVQARTLAKLQTPVSMPKTLDAQG